MKLSEIRPFDGFMCRVYGIGLGENVFLHRRVAISGKSHVMLTSADGNLRTRVTAASIKEIETIDSLDWKP